MKANGTCAVTSGSARAADALQTLANTTAENIPKIFALCFLMFHPPA